MTNLLISLKSSIMYLLFLCIQYTLPLSVQAEPRPKVCLALLSSCSRRLVKDSVMDSFSSSFFFDLSFFFIAYMAFRTDLCTNLMMIGVFELFFLEGRT